MSHLKPPESSVKEKIHPLVVVTSVPTWFDSPRGYYGVLNGGKPTRNR